MGLHSITISLCVLVCMCAGGDDGVGLHSITISLCVCVCVSVQEVMMEWASIVSLSV